MKAIQFEGSDNLRGAPGCFDIPTKERVIVQDGVERLEITSCWQFDADELKQVLEKGVIYLTFFNHQPIIRFQVESPEYPEIRMSFKAIAKRMWAEMDVTTMREVDGLMYITFQDVQFRLNKEELNQVYEHLADIKTNES